jgi:NAD(P)-dependent dehydrogenase (short-subunit alcohol dehydrogenase family)
VGFDVLQGLDGKVVLVTGAAGGIGSAACRRLSDEGARVVVSDIDEQAAVAVAGSLAGDAVGVGADISTAAGAAAAVAAAVEAFGGLDLAFLNAGVECLAAPVAQFSEAEYDRVFDVNVRGAFLSARSVVDHLTGAAKPGNILFTASIAGLQGSPTTSIYNASKHAVVGLSKCLALEVGSAGIRVNVLCPGVVDTRMMRSLEESMGAAAGISADDMKSAMAAGNTLGRYATPEEIAAMAAWILSDEAAYCHGETFTIGGGLMA